MSRKKRRGQAYISLRPVTIHQDGIRAAILTPHRTAIAFSGTTVWSWPAADWTIEHLLAAGRTLIIPAIPGQPMLLETLAPKHLLLLIEGGELSAMDALRVLNVAMRGPNQ
tara:strand:- start:1662 stop:1994 length:333 start_codon:yes stop_codon:yes gene_type:complete